MCPNLWILSQDIRTCTPSWDKGGDCHPAIGWKYTFWLIECLSATHREEQNRRPSGTLFQLHNGGQQVVLREQHVLAHLLKQKETRQGHMGGFGFSLNRGSVCVWWRDELMTPLILFLPLFALFPSQSCFVCHQYQPGSQGLFCSAAQHKCRLFFLAGAKYLNLANNSNEQQTLNSQTLMFTLLGTAPWSQDRGAVTASNPRRSDYPGLTIRESSGILRRTPASCRPPSRPH